MHQNTDSSMTEEIQLNLNDLNVDESSQPPTPPPIRRRIIFNQKTFICGDFLKNEYYNMAIQCNKKLDCVVCLEDICCRKCMAILPCGHYYHLSCLLQCKNCPLCRE